MDTATQLSGLDRFLNAIHDEPTDLRGMLESLGFDATQTRWLCDERLSDIAAALVDALRLKLTRGTQDLWFRVLSRRYGLDGEPGAPIDDVARLLGIDAAQASQAETDALQKCRYKNTLQDLRQQLHRIALEQLSKAGAQPGKPQVVAKLKRLADLRAALDVVNMDFEAKKAEILKKVQAELDALTAEYDPLLEAAQDNATALEQEIRNDVLLAGETVSTDIYQAVYQKGRVTWDTEGIGKYAAAHPEVLKYRKEGAPSVSIRTVR
jgi:hypothetical protein